MKRRRVVVVEDELAILQGLLDVLEASGYEAIGAADGEVGLDLGRQVGVDLVLLDLLLPKLDGFAVLTELRKTHPTLPVIILTARGAEEDRVRGLRSGADDYVVKPFSASELLARDRNRGLRPFRDRLSQRASDWSIGDGSRCAGASSGQPRARGLTGRVAHARLGHQRGQRRDTGHRHAHHPPARQA